MIAGLGRRIVNGWASLGPKYLPFADLATPDLPLPRLLRLSLFQLSVGMTLVLLVGTLNRVMIVEMGVPATIVAVMLALPLLFAPFRALIGYRSDTHRCELGWRRVPFVWKGTLLQFGGFSIMPFAMLVLAGMGESASAPLWLGHVSAALAFLLVGAGAHIVQTAGLALATDLTPDESHPRVVGLMYVTLLLGMMVSALVFGTLLQDFTPGRLVQVVQGTALACFVLNMVAIWKQEPRRPPRGAPQPTAEPGFSEAWAHFCRGGQTVRRLVIIGLGTIAFTMADVLLEPFGGEVLQWSVSATTRLTALFAFGGLAGFWFASHRLGSGGDAYLMARFGAIIGIPAFVLVMISAPYAQSVSFLSGNFLIGFGGAVFGHATLTATMKSAKQGKTGLAIGAWGAVQATAAGLAMALGGTIRDFVNLIPGSETLVGDIPGAAGYFAVYGLEILLLVVTIGAILPLVRIRTHNKSGVRARRRTAEADLI